MGVDRGERPLEKDIQREICDWLATIGVFFWRSNNLPAMGRPGADGEMRFRALPKYTPRGIPDILILHHGDFFGLEVKRPRAQIKPEQIEFGDKLKKNGGYYAIVYSLDDAMLKLGAIWPDVYPNLWRKNKGVILESVENNTARQTDE